MAEFTDDEKKLLKDLGAAIATLQKDLNDVKSTGGSAESIKKLESEILGVKTQVGKLTPATPATQESWGKFWDTVFPF